MVKIGPSYGPFIFLFLSLMGKDNKGEVVKLKRKKEKKRKKVRGSWKS